MLLYRNKLDVFFILLVSCVQTYVYFFIIYPEFYINGDNEFYNEAYNTISQMNVLAAYKAFPTAGGSGTEPVSFIILYLSSLIFSYEVYFLLSNVIFISALGFLLSKYYSSYKFPFIILSFSFYVFITSALTQRLSIALFFWICYEASYKRYRVLYLISILSHWQMVLTVIPNRLLIIFDSARKFRINWSTIILLIVFVLIMMTQFDSIYRKVDYFLRGGHLKAVTILVWPLSLMLIGYKLKRNDVAFFLLFFVVALIISSGRINVLCFFYSLFVMRGSSRKLFLFTILYTPLFIYKNIDYYFYNYNPGRVFSSLNVIGVN